MYSLRQLRSAGVYSVIYAKGNEAAYQAALLFTVYQSIW